MGKASTVAASCTEGGGAAESLTSSAMGPIVTAPATTLQGMACHWKSHVMLSGVQVTATSAIAVQADPAGGPLNLVGVLKGDVNGSWVAPAGSTDLNLTDPTCFQRLAELVGVPNQDQWGGGP